jgi:hypothetical protein
LQRFGVSIPGLTFHRDLAEVESIVIASADDLDASLPLEDQEVPGKLFRLALEGHELGLLVLKSALAGAVNARALQWPQVLNVPVRIHEKSDFQQ